MLEVSGLVKAFGNLRAVDGVDLVIDAGTITGLIGPNGAGKTTLFNLIAGALAPEAGAIARSTPSTARRFPKALTRPEISSMTPDYDKARRKPNIALWAER